MKAKKNIVTKKIGPTFSEQVLKAALAIPPGRVTTYGRIARAAGAGPMASQSITAVLSKAWEAGEHRIPWHRIVYADGHIWVSPEHRKERLKLYKKEGIELDANDRIVHFADILFDY